MVAALEQDLPPADLSGVVPRPLVPLASNLATPFAPARTQVAALRRVGEDVLGVPAEPTRDAAFGAEAALALGGLRGRTVALAQDYVGYAPLARDLDEHVFSAKAAWFGAELLPRLEAALQVAGTAVGAMPAGEPQGR